MSLSFILLHLYALRAKKNKTNIGDVLLSAASFYGDGFVQLKGTETSSRNTLHVRFRTSSLSGLLFLAAGQNDFLLLEMNAGRLQVSHVLLFHPQQCLDLPQQNYLWEHVNSVSA